MGAKPVKIPSHRTRDGFNATLCGVSSHNVERNTPRSRIESNHVIKGIRPGRSKLLKHTTDGRGDIEKAYAPLQERFDRDLIRRI